MLKADGQVKVLDFGLAWPVAGLAEGSTQQLSGVIAGPAGTLPYMAPETIQAGTATPASDVWSLGVLLYELTAGERPFDGVAAGELCTRIVRDPPRPLPSDVSPQLAAVIQRALQKEPGRRYGTMREMCAALEVPSGDSSVPSSAPARRVAGPAPRLACDCDGSARRARDRVARSRAVAQTPLMSPSVRSVTSCPCGRFRPFTSSLACIAPRRADRPVSRSSGLPTNHRPPAAAPAVSGS